MKRINLLLLLLFSPVLMYSMEEIEESKILNFETHLQDLILLRQEERWDDYELVVADPANFSSLDKDEMVYMSSEFIGIIKFYYKHDQVRDLLDHVRMGHSLASKEDISIVLECILQSINDIPMVYMTPVFVDIIKKFHYLENEQVKVLVDYVKECTIAPQSEIFVALEYILHLIDDTNENFHYLRCYHHECLNGDTLITLEDVYSSLKVFRK